MRKTITIPKEIENILEIFQKNGYEAYIVGGCVRDLLLNKIPNDFDITTSALPEETKSLFPKTIDTGIKHGTVTVVTENNELVEVTTYRTESEYNDMRRPQNVKFVKNIKEDLKRRDFTVNALAYNSQSGIIDYFDGISDLNNRILRAVGNPEERFSEDALRIMRLYRFSSVLGFSVEEKTNYCALKLCENLKNISAERVAAELIKAVCGKNPSALIPLVKTGGLKSFGIKYKKDFSSVCELSQNDNLKLYAFLKLCDCDIFDVIKKLKLSNKIKNYCEKAEKLQFLEHNSPETVIKLALSICDTPVFFDVLEYKALTEKKNYENIKTKAEKIIKSAEPYKISQLAVTGEELKNLGLKGEEIGEALEFLCKEVRKDPQKNDFKKLKNLLKK